MNYRKAKDGEVRCEECWHGKICNGGYGVICKLVNIKVMKNGTCDNAERGE